MRARLLFCCLMLQCVVLLVMSSCDKNVETKVETITIANSDSSGYSLEVDQEIQIDAIVTPNDALQPGLTYKTTNPDIFIVSAKGVIKGVRVGVAELIVKTQDGTYLRDARPVRVLPKTIQAEAIEISGIEEQELRVGYQYKREIKVKVIPEGANQSVKFISSDESVFTVNERGVMTGLKLGAQASLTVQSVSYPEVTASCIVRVVDLSVSDIVVPTDPILINDLGGTVNLKDMLTVLPEQAAELPLEYTSDAPTVVRVDETGVLTSVSRGTANITIRSGGSNIIERVVRVESEAEINNQTWTVTASSYHPGNGAPSTILMDGISGSEYWHSNWQGENTPLPHWLLIDMKSVQAINGFKIARRHTGRDLRKGTVAVSVDGQSFTEVGVIDFGDAPQSENTREIKFEIQQARFIRFTITESNRAPFASVNRAWVYGSLE